MSPETEGIEVRHRKSCKTGKEHGCTCKPGYRATVEMPRGRTGKRRLERKTLRSMKAAQQWRQQKLNEINQGLHAPELAPRLRDAARTLEEGMFSGKITTRGGHPYKPSTRRGCEQALRLRVLPYFGNPRISDITQFQVQALVDHMIEQNADGQTIRNTLLPLRVICRRAKQRGQLAVNPMKDLELPAARKRPIRFASHSEMKILLDALDGDCRDVFTMAAYTGMRLGELRALGVEDIDLKQGTIKVRFNWDPKEGRVEVKTKASRRTIPMTAQVRALVGRRIANGRTSGLLLGRTPGLPFSASGIVCQAERRWKKAGIKRITPHGCRHSYASYLIHAGFNAKIVQTRMGHASITTTYDLYGHLFDDDTGAEIRQLDLYLDRAG